MKPSEHERTRGCEWWVSVVTVTVFGSLLGVFLAALRITLSAAGDGPASYPLQPPLLAPSNSKSLVGVASSSAESAEQFGQWDAPSSQTLNSPMGNDDLPRGDDHGTHDSNQHGGKKEGGAGGGEAPAASSQVDLGMGLSKGCSKRIQVGVACESVTIRIRITIVIRRSSLVSTRMGFKSASIALVGQHSKMERIHSSTRK